MKRSIDIKNLIIQKVSESHSIEYKSGRNPVEILHSICAFANDIDGVDGGYIIIGIKAKDGMPEEVVGVNINFDKAQQELLRICSFIQPRYIPQIFEGEYENKKIFVLECSAGYGRPYRAPKSIDVKNNKNSQLLYYIRKLSSTIEANNNDIKELYEISKVIPFDDQVNPTATLEDLSKELIVEHLKESGSSFVGLSYKTSLEELATRLHLLDSGGHLYPRNVALLMFSEKTNEYFPEAYIDVVDARKKLTKEIPFKRFKGPIQYQLKNAYNYICNNFIEQKLIKFDSTLKTKSIYSYPEKAIKEILANAVYHKSYEIGEPITVLITQSYIEVKSFPGFDRTITDRDIKSGTIQSKRPYRNRRIGNFLLELGLTESRNTLIPTAEEALKENGSKPLLFLSDDSRTSLRVRIYKQEGFIVKEEVEVDSKSISEYQNEIIAVLSTGSYSMRSISSIIGLASPSANFRKAIKELLEAKTIICTGKGRSSKYSLKRSK